MPRAKSILNGRIGDLLTFKVSFHAPKVGQYSSSSAIVKT